MRNLLCRCWILLPMLALVAAPVPAASPAPEVLLTEFGFPLKVIVRTPTALRERPDAASPGHPVAAFDFFFVLPATDGTRDKLRNGFYRVASAPRRSAHAGYLEANAVVEWRHTQVVGFRPQKDRQLVSFFATAEEAERYYKGDNAVKPISREPARLTGTHLLPLLGLGSFTHEGESVPVYKVAYLHGAPERIARPQPTPRDTGSDAKLQVCFVLDTTQSMEPWIEAVKKAVADLVENLASDPKVKDHVEFGLVCFRDKVSNEENMKKMEYVARVASDLTVDHTKFQKLLKEVHQAEVSSEDVPEDVLAGLKMGIKEVSWRPGAARHIILIGDASAQVEKTGYKNVEKLTIEEVVQMAQPDDPDKVIQMHACRILSAYAYDHGRCKEHFEQIRIGRGEKLAGLHLEFNQEDPSGLTRTLATELRAGFKGLRTVRSGEASPLSPTEKRWVGMLEKVGDGATDAPSFSEGYAVALDRDGNQTLEPHVVVSRGRLDLLRSAINFAHTAVSSGEGDLQKNLDSLQLLAAQVHFPDPVDRTTPLSRILSHVLNLPVHNPIFDLSPEKLSTMPAKELEQWINRVRASEEVLQSLLKDPGKWLHLNEKPGRDADRIGFVRVVDLP